MTQNNAKNYNYYFGGSLPVESKTYVKRQADNLLFQNLQNAEFSYVLNSRQMGKSSLMLRTKQRLEENGIGCVAIDLTTIGSQNINVTQWYRGVVKQIVEGLELEINWKKWWKERQDEGISTVQMFGDFIREALLPEVANNDRQAVIFLDEIDSIINLDFGTDDFFAFIRACHNKRAEFPLYNCLTFCLLGVATPSDLIGDKTRTPFNIGTAIELTGFTFAEAKDALTPGLAEKVDDPNAVLKKVLKLTGGQPFLTQKLCNLVVNYAEASSPDISQLVQTCIINNWEGQDNPEHLRTIRDRILRNEQNTSRLLGLYRRVLISKVAADASTEQMELRLSGLVVKRDGCLQVYNDIYRGIFDRGWIEVELNKLRPYSEAINGWLKSGHQDTSRLLRGETLEEALEWGREKNLSVEDYAFLSESQAIDRQEEKQAKEILAEATEKAQRTIRLGGVGFGVAVIATIAATAVTTIYSQQQLREARDQLLEVKEGAKLEVASSIALRDFEYFQLQGLLSAVKTGQALRVMVRDNPPLEEYPATTPLFALQQILSKIKERNQIPHDVEVTSVSFSPDGKMLATASSDKTARLWDLEGNLIQEFVGHISVVTSVSFSPDGKMLATASSDKTARLWDLEGNLIQEFVGHISVVTSVSFSPDGKMLATASSDKTARLWDLEGNLIKKFVGHEDYVTSVSFSPDGKMLATASFDKTAQLWDLEGNLIEEFVGHRGFVTSVGFSPDGKMLATASFDETAQLWDLQGNLIEKFAGHTDKITSVSFSPDGKMLATASFDKTARLWDLEGNLIEEFVGHRGFVTSVSFSPDGKTLATASSDDNARLWNLSDIVEFAGHRGLVWSTSFSPDSKMLATASSDNTARLWDLSGNQIATELVGHGGLVWSVSFSPDGKMLATASSDKTARLWNLQGKEIEKFVGHGNQVRNVSFSPGGKMLATASYDKTARLWDMEGNLIEEFVGHEDYVTSVSFSPDGNMLATASSDNTARLWDLEGNLIEEFVGHTDSVTSVSFSPDGKMLATASSDHTARLWDLEGNQIAKFVEHIDSVWSVSFSPDGKMLATASQDSTVKLWDLEGSQIAHFVRDTNALTSASFSPNGKMLAIASSDHTAWLLPVGNLELEELLGRGCEWLGGYFVNHPEALAELEVCGEVGKRQEAKGKS